MTTALNMGEANLVVVDRQFLLFQLEFSAAARDLLVSDQQLQKLSTLAGGLRFVDPVDYDNPQGNLYWRNVLGNPNYQKELKQAFTDFQTNLLAQIPPDGDGVTLRSQFPGEPFLNISRLVRDISNYTVALNQTDNRLSLSINSPAFLASRGPSGDIGDPKTLMDIFAQVNPRENDVLMVMVSYDRGQTYKPEFLGLLTNIRKQTAYGAIQNFTTDVYGLSKLFYTTMCIRQQAINDTQFLPGVEINDPQTTSPYSDQFNGMNTKTLFGYLLRQTFALIPEVRPPEIAPPSQLQRYLLDNNVFQAATKPGFQYSIMVLLTLYLMGKAVVTATGSSITASLFPGSENGGVPVFSNPYRGVIEHGDHKTFNEMVANAFENFFSQLSFPHDILDEIRKTTYYDVFESRDGVIVCRPPRYNRIDTTVTESLHLTLDDGIDNILVAKKPDADGAISGYEFNRNSDFFIRNEELGKDLSFDKNDLDLDSRIDCKFTMPYDGPQDFPAGHFTDIEALIQYGLRSKGVITNPNVLNSQLGTLFAPIALGMHNAATRTLTGTAVDTRRPLRVGKLYYIEALGAVAFLDNAGIQHGYGNLSTIQVSMAMVRKIQDRPVIDIMKNSNEILNFGLMYLGDPVIPTDTVAHTAAAKKAFIQRSQEMLLALLNKNPGNQGLTIPMFRYVPTILDLILDVEVTPGLAKKSPNPADTKPLTAQQEQQNEAIGGAIVDSGICWANGMGTAGVDAATFRGYIETFKSLATTADLTTKTPVPAAITAYRGTLTTNFVRAISAVKIAAETIISDGLLTARTTAPIEVVSTPVATSLVAANANNFKFSEVLVNKLASLDLALKFSAFPVTLNHGGFPQLYDSETFGLFEAGASVGRATDIANSSFVNLTPNPLTLPNVLKLDTVKNVFANQFFSLPASTPGSPMATYGLPFGHLVYRQPSLGFPLVLLGLLNPDGGMYTVATNPLVANGFTITGQNKKFKISAADGDKQTQDVVTVDGLYFISPFTDLSVERLLGAPYDPQLVGYRTQAVTTKTVLTNMTPSLKSSENDSHTKGLAIDLCPDYLMAASKSRLGIIQTSPGQGPFFTAFQAFLATYFTLGTNWWNIRKALTLTPKYVDGTTATVSALIYHLTATEADVMAYRQSLRLSGQPQPLPVVPTKVKP